MSKKINVLFFGNTPNNNESKSFGGATILALNILNYIKNSNDYHVTHYNIRKTWIPKLHLIDHLFWIFKFPFVIKEKDIISFHTTWDFNFTVGPILWLISKIYRKKIVYHFFGGDFHEHYSKLPSVLKKIYFNTILKSDTLFFETNESLRYFEKLGVKNLEWLPNAREKMISVLEDKLFRKKFVFISRIIPEKGVDEIIRVSNELNDDFTFDLYGPIDKRYMGVNSFIGGKAKYKGEIKPSEVGSILKQYDILVLPTFFSGEGYPGIIIEALSYGIPVITTNWKAIPEIIIDGYNGILISPQNSDELRKAIESIDTSNYNVFRVNAFKSFDNFDSEIVFKKIIKSYSDD